MPVPEQSGVFASVGEWFVGAAVTFVGFVFSIFTKRHIESMDKLSSKIENLGNDVSEIKSDIRVLRQRQENVEHRIDKLEDDS